MSNYVKATNFTSKDTLPPGDPLKIVKGTEFDTEFNAIQTAVNTKADTNSPTLTGVPLAPTAAPTANNTQIANTSFVKTAVGTATPTGEIKMWPMPSIPDGYVACLGQALSRSTFSALFAVLSTTYGAGDGSTTFNVPDFRDRMPIGAGNLYAVNQLGGSADAIVVSHSHTATVNDPGHAHAYETGLTPVGGASGTDLRNNWQTINTASATTNISVGISATGGSGAGANLPPYRGIYFIIKT